MELSVVPSFQFRRPSAEALTWLVTVTMLAVGSLLPEPDSGMLITVARGVLALLPVVAVAALLAGALTLGNWSDRALSWLSGGPVRAVVVASFVGSVTPVCGLGALPLIATLWSIFSKVREEFSNREFLTESGMFRRLERHLSTAGHTPFEYCVIDEAQDIGVAELRLLSVIGGGRPNSLFFAGDLGQRIFQTSFSCLVCPGR